MESQKPLRIYVIYVLYKQRAAAVPFNMEFGGEPVAAVRGIISAAGHRMACGRN
jgi:hypothetical protein